MVLENPTGRRRGVDDLRELNSPVGETVRGPQLSMCETEAGGLGSVAGTIVVGWNETSAVPRALATAMPCSKELKRVVLLSRVLAVGAWLLATRSPTISLEWCVIRDVGVRPFSAGSTQQQSGQVLPDSCRATVRATCPGCPSERSAASSVLSHTATILQPESVVRARKT
jgi:hypothetical protein